MTQKNQLSRVLLQLAMVGLVSFGPTVVSAQTLESQIASSVAERFQDQADRIQALERSGDAASKVELARLFLRGTLISATNPLPQIDLDRAEALLDEVIAAGNSAVSQRALSLKTEVLTHRGTPEAVAEAAGINARLLREGYAPTVAGAITSGAPLPVEIREADAIAALEGRVLAGDLAATEALSALLASRDPERSKALADQALMMSMAAATTDAKSSADLGQRYIDGRGVPMNATEGLRLLKEAAVGGSNDALKALRQRSSDGLDAGEQEDMRTVIVAALAAGSSEAADIIVSDLLEAPVYGFSRADALVALRLLRETGNREALLKSVQLYAGGGESAPDLDTAIPLIEELVQTDGQSADEIMRVAKKLASVGLPIALALKYVEPMFRSIGGPQADEANYQANRILAAAAEAGISSARGLPPERSATVLSELRDAGSRGHAQSLLLLGDLYYTGIWVPQTYRQALQYYEQAYALEPDLVARERTAKALLQIKQTPFEEERFETLVTELASTGSDWGRYRYGLLLIAGTSKRPPDVAAGEELLLSLSSKGFAPAVKAMVGRLRDERDQGRVDRAIAAFTKAWNVRKDFKTGLQLGEFYILAGRPDDARSVLGDAMFAKDAAALLMLARMEAEIQPANAARAYELATAGLAVATDDALAVSLAQLLLTLDLPQAKAEGEQRLQQLAEAGNVDAMGLLVTSYLDRLKTDASVLPTVLGWTTTLAEAGEVAPIIELAATYLAPGADAAIASEVLVAAEDALTFLPADSYVAVLVAYAHYNGWGGTADVAKGNALIETAAAAGNSDALAELGLQYFYGMGRERKPDTGIALLSSAAALGHGAARVELGRLSSSAMGPGIDRVKAYSMFLDAAGQGSSAGMLEVGRLYLAGWGIGQDEARGVEWLEKAASLGSLDAMYQLYFHYHSKSDAKSQRLARSWLDRSVEAGVNPAKLRLAVHLLSTEGSTPGTSGYDDAVTLLDDAFTSGYNTARKFSQTTTDFKLPTPGGERSR